MVEIVMALWTRFLKNTELPSIRRSPLFLLLHTPVVTANAIAREQTAKSLKNLKTENCDLPPRKLGIEECTCVHAEVSHRMTVRHVCETTMKMDKHDHRMHLLGYSQEKKGAQIPYCKAVIRKTLKSR